MKATQGSQLQYLRRLKQPQGPGCGAVMGLLSALIRVALSIIALRCACAMLFTGNGWEVKYMVF